MKYLISLFFLFIFSCSSNKEKIEPKVYSEETNRAFEIIERGYLKKAPSTASAPPQIETPVIKKTGATQQFFEKKREVEVLKPGQQKGVKEEILVDDKINLNENETLSEKSSLPQMAKEKSSSKADERMIEINQNLAYYCMKQRKNSTFGGDESKCMKFVNKSMKQCQKIHHIVNSHLLNCIQSKLKSRR